MDVSKKHDEINEMNSGFYIRLIPRFHLNILPEIERIHKKTVHENAIYQMRIECNVQII